MLCDDPHCSNRLCAQEQRKKELTAAKTEKEFSKAVNSLVDAMLIPNHESRFFVVKDRAGVDWSAEAKKEMAKPALSFDTLAMYDLLMKEQEKAITEAFRVPLKYLCIDYPSLITTTPKEKPDMKKFDVEVKTKQTVEVPSVNLAPAGVKKTTVEVTPAGVVFVNGVCLDGVKFENVTQHDLNVVDYSVRYYIDRNRYFERRIETKVFLGLPGATKLTISWFNDGGEFVRCATETPPSVQRLAEQAAKK